jgi:CSLREA domain-containing protein
MRKVFRFSIPFAVAFLILCASLLLVDASAVSGQPIAGAPGALLVNTLDDELNDDGDCSLREAVQAANTNAAVDACASGDDEDIDTITFGVTGMITLAEQLSVTAAGPLVIEGAGEVTLRGGGSVRVLFVDSDAELALQNLTIANGYSDGSGGGIYNLGRLTITSSTLSGNTADYGGGIYNNAGTLTIMDSTLSGNIAAYAGGGIYCNYGTLTLMDSTLSGNTAGTYGGGIDNSFGIMTIINSTLSGNTAADTGGGIDSYEGTLSITNSTLSGNTAGSSGGGISSYGTLTITNSTLSGNTADDGGGIENAYGTLTVTNTIIANSLSGGDCYTPALITDGGHNISSDDSCGFDIDNGSLPNTNPLLDILQDNGGPTLTNALLVDSPAIDAADNTQCPLTDQRGFHRPFDGDEDGTAVCDIGSYEYQHSSPSLVMITGAVDGFIQQSYSFTAAVEPLYTTLPLTYTWQADGQLPIIHTSGLTDTVAFTWDTPGTYMLTVSAANITGTVSDTHSITITDQPVAGLVAFNDSPTTLGEVTILSATVTGGTNVVYTWDFGDGKLGSGQVVTHTYAETGVYTATVTAKNANNSLSTTTLVTITALAPSREVYLPLVIKE